MKPIITEMDTYELEELADAIEIELNERKDRRDIIRARYQQEFDELVERMEEDDFYLDMPDEPSFNFVVKDAHNLGK